MTCNLLSRSLKYISHSVLPTHNLVWIDLERYNVAYPSICFFKKHHVKSTCIHLKIVNIKFCDTRSSSLSSTWFKKFNVTTILAQIWQIFDFSNNIVAQHYWNTSAQHILCYSAFEHCSTPTVNSLNIYWILLMLGTYYIFLAWHLKFSQLQLIAWNLNIFTRHTLDFAFSRHLLKNFLGMN